ncbi:MAG: glutathione S-transferase [Myxococcota bacterium]
MTSLRELVDATNAPLMDPVRNRTIGTSPPRYELYHFALSLCSQKVRLVLAETGADYAAHDINLSLPSLANYEPAYVRLRLEGRGEAPLVSGYTGGSSTTTEGFDPAVVPTLVDLEREEVVVDSLRICRHVDREAGGALVPDTLRDAIVRELDLVDRTPHVALFYGAHPDADVRPERLRKGMPGVHDRKIAKLRMARERAAGDALLEAAYDAKIAKEEAARGFVGTPERMRAALAETLELVGGLEGRLGEGPFLFGARYTLADVFWAVSLHRLRWLGMAFAWEGGHALHGETRPRVGAYVSRLVARPAFRAACIEWPLMPPSEHL